MFNRKSNQPAAGDRPATDRRQIIDTLLGSMSGEERVETRAKAIGLILSGLRGELGKKSAGALHLITAGDASARAHADALKTMFDMLGFTVARLSAGDPDRARAKAYRADLVVGSFADFAADLGREKALKITRHAVLIERGPESAGPDAERTLVSAYRTTYSG